MNEIDLIVADIIAELINRPGFSEVFDNFPEGYDEELFNCIRAIIQDGLKDE